MEKLRGKPAGVPIIASGRASFAALLSLLNAVEPAAAVRVIVRPTTAANKSQNDVYVEAGTEWFERDTYSWGRP